MRASTGQRAPRREDSDFHSEKIRNFKRFLDSVVQSGRITPEDYALINSYIQERKAVVGMGESRSRKMASILVNWRRFIGPFQQNTLNDIYQGITRRRQELYVGKPVRQNTLRDYISALKRFSLWLSRNKYSAIQEKDLKAIMVPHSDTMTVTAEDLLTQEEIEALILACQNTRDRALIAILYEGGFRIKELATLTWSQVNFDQWGVLINVNVKTERPRHIRIIASTSYLAQWKDDYPFEPSGDALVFLTAQRNPLEYTQIWTQIKKIAKRAGIKKNVRPHLFRHSRVTHLQRLGVPEPIIKKMCWGHQDTKMLGIYGHLHDEDIDNALLSLHGIQVPGKVDSRAMKAQQCRECMAINSPTSRYCHICGQPLTEDERATMKQIVREIEKHPLYKSVISDTEKKMEEVY